jgi:hypothetical protein
MPFVPTGNRRLSGQRSGNVPGVAWDLGRCVLAPGDLYRSNLGIDALQIPDFSGLFNAVGYTRYDEYFEMIRHAD